MLIQLILSMDRKLIGHVEKKKIGNIRPTHYIVKEVDL